MFIVYDNIEIVASMKCDLTLSSMSLKRKKNAKIRHKISWSRHARIKHVQSSLRYLQKNKQKNSVVWQRHHIGDIKSLCFYLFYFIFVCVCGG